MNQGEQIADLLLEIKAVQINTTEPFRYTSGLLSPIYCDNRLIISYPKARNRVIQGFIDKIEQQHLTCDVIAGTATAGIPHAAWIADRLERPMIYVRSNAKQHGKHNQIEGHIEPGQSVLVIEDLISTGGSAIAAVQALQQQQLTATHCLAIFNYQLPQSTQAFRDAQIELHTLTTLDTLLNVAVQHGTITNDERQHVTEWRSNPQQWQTV